MNTNKPLKNSCDITEKDLQLHCTIIKNTLLLDIVFLIEGNQGLDSILKGEE